MASNNLSKYSLDLSISTENLRIAIVVSEWNSHITENLLQGAQSTLLEFGLNEESIVVNHVPGSFELIYGCHKMAKGSLFDAVIAIGCVIRGETSHFDYVSQAVAQGIKDVNLQTSTPTIFCVLTDDKEEQSMDRSGGKKGNKGVEAAIAALRMAEFRSKEI